MLNKLPGDEWQRHANLRALYVYQFVHPGKKLLFMGTEFGQGTEWNSAAVLDWYVLDYPLHKGLQTLVRDLSHLYSGNPSLYRNDFDWQGFDWIDCNDAEKSVLVFLRKGHDEKVVVVAVNFTPVPRHNFRIGVPRAGAYRELINSDMSQYGGSGLHNGSSPIQAEEHPWMNQPYSLEIALPPMAAVVLGVEDVKKATATRSKKSKANLSVR
jgi:1,4-alpha-glucan branching enzyme